jgi:hypothetical protein
MQTTDTAGPIAAHRKYQSIEETARLFPFTPAALRNLVFKMSDRKSSRGEIIKGNGLADAGAVVRIGGRVLIDVEAFGRWIESHKERAQ